MKKESELYQFYKSELLSSLKMLETERKTIVNKLIIALAIIICTVAFFLLLIGFSNFNLCVFIALIGSIIYGFLYKFITANFVINFKDNIICRIINFIDKVLQYYPKGYIDKSKFLLSGIFTQSVDEYTGDDHVIGRIDKTSIEFSELEAKHVTRDSKGRKHTTKIFHGLFFIADFNKDFNSALVVLPDTAQALFGKFGQTLQSINFTRKGELIKLEDPEFEKLFAVYGNNQIEARYILSPALMERIKEFKKKSGKKIFLSFIASKVFVAIDYNRNLFEPGIWNSLIDFEPVKEYFKDLTAAIGIVEDLNLNLRIWSKE